MKKGFVFLNGDQPDKAILESLDYTNKFIVCADGAYDYLKSYCLPDVLLGDFDSIKSRPEGCKIKKFPADKDYTDGHLAILEMAENNIFEVEIFGAFGGRPDHEYANFALLALASSLNIKAVIRGDFDIYFVKDEIKLDVVKNMTVSIVPYTDKAHIIKTEGLKYSATSLDLNKFHIIGVSNEATDNEIYVSVGEGSILLFVQRR